MAITAYTGLPGSGKSYTVVKHVIVPALERAKKAISQDKPYQPVWTNIPMNVGAVERDFGIVPVYFSLDDVKEKEDWFQNTLPKGVICVIDELWKLWPQGIKASAAVYGHKEYINEHRHDVGENGYSSVCVFVTQDLSDVATWARDKVTNTSRTTNMKAFGKMGAQRFRIDLYEGSVKGQRPPASLKGVESFDKYEHDFYQYYKSHTKSATGAAGIEVIADDRSNLLKSFKVKAFLVIMAVGIPSVIYGLFQVPTMVFGNAKVAELGKVLPDDNVSKQTHSGARDSSKAKPVKQVKPKKPDFLRGYELYIDWATGSYPSYDYIITAENGDKTFKTNAIDLFRLGYEIKAYTDCLASIAVNDTIYTATCRANEKEQALFAVHSAGI